MQFAHPQFLWLLLVIPPALVAFFWWAWKKNRELSARFIEARLMPSLVAGFSPGRRKVRLASLVLAVVCLILALARPQWGFVWEEVKQRGLDIVVAIDTSKSMLAQDLAPNRLARAKLAALDLMKAAKSDRLGLVAFAGSAFLQCPLTIDDAAFRQSVESLDVTSVSEGGTAIAEAIDTALTAFKEGDNHKILVVLTDGEDHDSQALEAARRAAEAELQIFTIGVGTPEGELLRIPTPAGQPDYIRDEQGNVVKSKLDENLLREIAGASARGFYLPMRGAKTIDTLYQEGLAPLPKSESNEKLVKRYQERFHWPLALAIALLIGEMLFSERKTRPAPRSVPAVPAATAMILLALALPGSAMASPSGALRDYRQGNYQEALKEYEQLLRRNPQDPRLHFNAGAAAYQNDQFEEAVRQFDQALNTPDLTLQQRAFYNRGNTLYRLGENLPDPQKRSEAWQRSIKDFESSLKLDPQDEDARFNQAYVKQRLEELKQQQQQQQQQDKSDQQKEDQGQNQEQQPGQDNPQNSQQEQSQPQQQQGQEQKNPQEQQAQPKDSEKQQEQERQQAQQQSSTNQQAGASGQKPDGESPDQQEQEQQAAAGNMTPEQARQLLDSQQGEEQVLPMNAEKKPSDHSRSKRDW